MKWIPGLVLIAACAASPASRAPPPMATAPCPAIECPEPVCAACPGCPTCPEPEPERVTAADWHCLDLHRTDGSVSGYCFTLPEVCEAQRDYAVSEKLGTPGPCFTQRAAFCLRVTDPYAMSRQVMCARTLEGCEVRHAYLRDYPRDATDELGPCEESLNTDPFTERHNAIDDERAP